MHTIIYFLAHDGVKQPEVWETWLEECKELAKTQNRNVLARIFCNPDKVHDPFMKGRVLPFHIPTRWSDPSLVKVLQEGYKHILKEFNNLDLICLVSGYDIPIMKPSEFLKLSIQSYVPLIPYKLDKLPTKTYKTLEISKFSKKQPTRFATQWIHLTKKHAEIISKSNLDSYVDWLKSLNKDASQNYVYDEVLPCAMLEAAGVLKELKDEPLTAMERKNIGDPSPIVFRSLNGKYVVNREELEDGEIEEENFSLNQVLKEYREDEFVFFRKVSESVIFEKMPWL
jgi:hypothetical protein